jgi:hypothetical protein
MERSDSSRSGDRGRRSWRPLGRRQLLGLVVGAGALAWALPASASGPTMITSCTQAAVESAVSHGGTVEFAQNCEVVLSSTISLHNLNVDIEANGYSVVLNGQSSVRIMSITGGDVTIGGIAFFHGDVTGTAGVAGAPGPGTAGSSATGGALLISSGTVALNDDNFEYDAVQGGTGGNGGAGTAGTEGAAGATGAPGSTGTAGTAALLTGARSQTPERSR